MRCAPTPLEGVKRIELSLHGDARGFFVERYSRAKFAEMGLPTDWAQDNHSRSAPRTLRGLHYQTNPAQGKLVGVIRGRVWDVAVDIRPGSATFGRHYGLELSGENGVLLWIPPGFAHGFCVLGDEPADMLYKVDGAYNPAGEGGIRHDDAKLNIPWPVKDPIISQRDRELPGFDAYAGAAPAW